MAAKEMYDYYTGTVTPDYNATLSLTPQRVLTEMGHKNQVVHIADDNSEERISLSSSSIFYVTLVWEVLNESDSGTIFDWYFDPAKANGVVNSFKWGHPTDTHTYTVRFDGDLSRSIRLGSIYSINEIKLKILGIAP